MKKIPNKLLAIIKIRENNWECDSRECAGIIAIFLEGILEFFKKEVKKEEKKWNKKKNKKIK